MEYTSAIYDFVKPGQHKLPPLPYAYNALEPILNEETMRIHHDKHHQSYVDTLNKAELNLVEARKKDNYNYIKYWSGELAFAGSGHILHSIYWTVMASLGHGGKPMSQTERMILEYFESMTAFQAQFKRAANAVEGGGWGIFAYNPAFGHLEILQCEKHQNLTQWGVIPILVCDVWEHAYYLQYQNKRSDFIEKWWELINWHEVERRLVLAQKAKMPLEMDR